MNHTPQSPTTSTPAPDIAILIVSWNVRELLLGCLNALPEAVGDAYSYEVILVDNASSDGTVEAVQEAFPHVRIIANKENRGFTRGNNQALAATQARYLFLLNPDTQPLPDSIATLARYLDQHPQVGMVGPRLWYGDGRPQPSRRRFPTLLTLFTESTIIQHYLPQLPIFAHFIMADVPDDAPQEVDWLVGAAIMVRREVYEQIGGLDEGFFMYSEELDWCHRAKDAGWRIAYHPAAEIIHYEGKSSEQARARRDIAFFTSRVRYTRKYFGPLWAELLRGWLLSTFAFLWLREGAKWRVGHKRALRAQRMAAYVQVLRSGLK
ncbi:MAG TPA: glycosyltransferase family 2 protein [Anaerolineae bacterium]|nr:glycosyltransferase family 2 protein [Caldilineae bacterium]HID33207.1 glycosyltransferase family 2 protein [Anaerolineae bacterium]HIQ12113.1 glycosyltransferase family 2 protein [Caldilineales bacterium]